jgi:hypothetical protein
MYNTSQNYIRQFLKIYFYWIIIKNRKTIRTFKNEILKKLIIDYRSFIELFLTDLLFISGAFSIFDFQVEKRKYRLN